MHRNNTGTAWPTWRDRARGEGGANRREARQQQTEPQQARDKPSAAHRRGSGMGRAAENCPWIQGRNPSDFNEVVLASVKDVTRSCKVMRGTALPGKELQGRAGRRWARTGVALRGRAGRGLERLG